MYSLSIHFGPSPVPVQFLFKDKERASLAYESITESIKDGRMSRIEDDFGQIGTIGGIDGYFIEDLELGEEARILRALSHARGQAKANERGNTDPLLRRAMTQGRSPSMITPFTNGTF